MTRLPVTVAIPTYRRGAILLETLGRLRQLSATPDEILVIDQTADHPEAVATQLRAGAAEGAWRWLRLERPSIPKAMNRALLESRNELILFADDDVIPSPTWLAAHLEADQLRRSGLVAGQVLLEGQLPDRGEGDSFRFSSQVPQWVREFMGGNFSVQRDWALEIGGFDENFHGAAYRFEAEFAARWLASGRRIWYEPRASLVHLQAATGGVRAHGDHRRTLLPLHAVGEYYYWLVARGRPVPWLKVMARPVRAIRTRHHLRRPWWIPGTLLAELVGLGWAAYLAVRGPRLLGSEVRQA